MDNVSKPSSQLKIQIQTFIFLRKIQNLISFQLGKA